MTDKEVETVWRWGDAFILSWSNWATTEPNSLTGQNCVVRRYTGKWEGVPCSDSYSFYCETDGKG